MMNTRLTGFDLNIRPVLTWEVVAFRGQVPVPLWVSVNHREPTAWLPLSSKCFDRMLFIRGQR